MPASLFFLFALLLLPLVAENTSKPKRVCLNMIVKDESHVIIRCLESVKDSIDYWVIVDTGSTDGTQKIIQNYLKDIPGELHQRPWVDFAHNRNEALSRAKGKGDYLLFIDADEQLSFTNPLDKSKLDKDYYLAAVKQSNSSYQRILLINNRLSWKWKGVLHEMLDSEEAQTSYVLDNVVTLSSTLDGNRSRDPQKYKKDAEVLEKALLSEPENARYVYFLAQSYLSAKEFIKALENFEKRACMGGWDQEVFFSLYRSGMLREYLNKPSETIIQRYSQAYQIRPCRAEPLYRLACYFNRQGNPVLGYAVAQLGITIPNPHDIVHTEDWIYEYGMLSIYADTASALNKTTETKEAYEKLLKEPNLPQEMRQSIKYTERDSKVGISSASKPRGSKIVSDPILT